jgi:hypothetical protein
MIAGTALDLVRSLYPNLVWVGPAKAACAEAALVQAHPRLRIRLERTSATEWTARLMFKAEQGCANHYVFAERKGPDAHACLKAVVSEAAHLGRTILKVLA